MDMEIWYFICETINTARYRRYRLKGGDTGEGRRELK